MRINIKKMLLMLGAIAILMDFALIGYYFIGAKEKTEVMNGIVTNIWIEKNELERFRDNGIKYLFVDVGDISKEGKLLTESIEIKRFTGLLDEYEKESGYDFKALPYTEVNTDEYNLTAEFKKNFINDFSGLTESGFDGFFIDIEPVKTAIRGDFVDFLDTIRAKYPEKLLAVYSGSWTDSPDSDWEWDFDLFRKVSEKSDIIVVPVYDSGIKDAGEYKDYIEKQFTEIAKRNWEKKFLIGVPSHRDFPETTKNSLDICYSELVKNPGSAVKGVSIFSSWTIDNSEWSSYRDFIKKIK